MTPIKVIKATKDNIKDIARIEQSCFSIPWTEKSIEESMAGGNLFFNIAYADGKIGDTWFDAH